jgi:AAA domain/DnaB-like helicase N terminal domain
MTGDQIMIEGLERVLLAAMMNGQGNLPVLERDFSSPPNRTIFQHIRQSEAGGLLAVQDQLQRRRKLAEVGGAAGLTEIYCLPTDKANVEYALGEVLNASRQRDAVKIGQQLVSGAITPEKAQEQLAQLNRRDRGKSWSTALSESTVTSSELRGLQLTPRKKLLGDWFAEGDCGFIFAFRGVGKTWLALEIAQALSTGGKLGDWEAPQPVKVLYLDSEMPADLMRSRSIGLSTGDNFQIINHEILFDRTGKILNIAEPEIQNAITKHCVETGVKVLFVDNLSTAAFGLKENEADSWEKMLPWLLDLRRRKIAVVTVHHAGRSGEMRGTSKREDALFWILALDDVKKNADDKRGARFVSHFTKPSRNTQDEVPAYEWHFVTEANGEVSISHKPAQSLDVFRGVIESGVTKCDEIADAMKLPKYQISRMAKKAIDAGWLTKNRQEYVLTGTTRERPK